MNKNRLFSIIIPTYKNLELLQRALNSVLKQSYKYYEVIVVDDSPSDIIDKYVHNLNDKVINYVHNKPSKGAVPNWNYGLSLAKGDYIILLHHDEAFESENHLLKLNELMTNYNVIISNVKVEINGIEKKNFFIRYGKRIMLKIPELIFLINCIGPTACVCINNKCIEHFNNNLIWLVDIEWYFKILRHNDYAFCNLTILSLHGHKEQITKSINIEEREKADITYLYQHYQDRNIRIILILRKFLYNIKYKLTLK